MPYIIAVDGVIAAGKTTFIKQLQEHLQRKFEDKKVIVYLEPIEKWGSLLSNFYKDPSKYGFAFQLNVILDKIVFLKKVEKEQIVILERSLLGDSVFMRNLYESGKVSFEEYEVYMNALHIFLQDENTYPLNLNLFLQTDIDLCMKRIEKRGRECELKIPEDYQKTLENILMDVFKDAYTKDRIKIELTLNRDSKDPYLLFVYGNTSLYDLKEVICKDIKLHLDSNGNLDK